MAEIISTKCRKARKPHTCDYCGELINPGETFPGIARAMAEQWG